MRIAVFNQKGGVGKTTTTINLGAALHARGTCPLLIDLDPQAHLSAIHSHSAIESAQSIYAHFFANAPLSSLMREWPTIGSLIPAHGELIKVDSVLGKGPNALNKLNTGLHEMGDPDRHILIDCCPFLGVLALNAIFAAELILIPVSSDFLSMRAATQVEHTLKALEPVLKRRIERKYLLTRFDRRRKMCFEIQDNMRQRFGTEICETVISENVAIAEAPAHSRSIFTHEPSSRGAKDYQALAEESNNWGFSKPV
jgi:chromosome partitioning protein